MSGAYKYLGDEGSLNLRHGMVCILNIETISFDGRIMVKMGDLFQCPYKDWAYFRKYWEPVE